MMELRHKKEISPVMMGSAGDPNSFLSGGTVPRDIVASPTKLIVGLNFYCYHEKHLLAIYL